MVGKEIMNEFKQKAKAANTLSPEDIKKVGFFALVWLSCAFFDFFFF